MSGTLVSGTDLHRTETSLDARWMLPSGAVAVDVAGEMLWLLPERAAFWPARGTLFVADAHIGKAASFRSAGVAIPAGTTASDLDRLSHLIQQLGAYQVAFLGDLLHSRRGRQARTLEAFRAWRALHAGVEMLLVRGNHDRRAGDPPPDWHVECVDQPVVLGGFALCHDPQSIEGCYALAGHVHPAVRMIGKGRDRARLPCFLLRPDQAILPAFSRFTGTFTLVPERDDRVFVVADDRVMPAQ
jgi:DNA ligase-associated metallophosphoesterase